MSWNTLGRQHGKPYPPPGPGTPHTSASTGPGRLAQADRSLGRASCLWKQRSGLHRTVIHGPSGVGQVWVGFPPVGLVLEQRQVLGMMRATVASSKHIGPGPVGLEQRHGHTDRQPVAALTELDTRLARWRGAPQAVSSAATRVIGTAYRRPVPPVTVQPQGCAGLAGRAVLSGYGVMPRAALTPGMLRDRCPMQIRHDLGTGSCTGPSSRRRRGAMVGRQNHRRRCWFQRPRRCVKHRSGQSFGIRACVRCSV
jgi:hypothetical protein